MTRIRRDAETTVMVARLLLILVFVLAQLGQHPITMTPRGAGVIALTLVTAGALVLTPLRRTREERATAAASGIPIRLALITVASIGLLALAPNSEPAIVVMLFVVGVAAARYPLARALPVATLAGAGLLVIGLAEGRWNQELSLVGSTCVVFLIAYSVRQGRVARSAEARQDVLAERARIAREIHDILAHSLSAQIVHLEGARLLLRADRSEEALDRVERARDLAKNGLEEAGRAVAALRDDSPPLPVALKGLAEEFQAATGRTCALTVNGPERRLAPEAELAVIRTAQEALTNVRRHAPGAGAEVRLDFEQGACELDVTNPAGDGPGTPGGGYGLVGMRERAELLGGILEAGPAGDGFRVRLRLPSPARA